MGWMEMWRIGNVKRMGMIYGFRYQIAPYVF